MSIIKITPDLIEQVTMTTHPKRVFVSSSQGGVNDKPVMDSGVLSPTGTMGQVSLMARNNRVIKGIREFNPDSALFNEDLSKTLIFLDSAAKWPALAETIGWNPYDLGNFLGVATSGSHISTDDGNCAGALVTINSIPTNGHTLILTDADGTSDTYTFSTSVTQEDSTKSNVGISGVDTTSGVATSLRISINLASLDDDIQITAAIPASNELTVYMLTKGTAGNGKTITGTAVSAESISVSSFSGGTPKLDSEGRYMGAVRQLSLPAKNSKAFSITRFRPPFLFQSDENQGQGGDNSSPESFDAKRRIVKNQVRNILLPHYMSKFTHPNYAYTNYHTLNFFTSSINWQLTKPYATSTEITSSPYKWMNGSVLAYPCLTGSLNTTFTSNEQYALRAKRFDGRYTPESAFTFDFYINPRYGNDVRPTAGGPKKGDFRPGTIFHMSGTYAISLVSGSSKAADGSANGFRILVQLSQSAEYPPSKWKILPGHDRPIFGANNSNYKQDPYGYAWVSPDNVLRRDHWHHVAIRWGGSKVNNGTGSFVIDGNIVSEFVITGTDSIRPFVNHSFGGVRARADRFLAGRADPNALFIGNFYEGTNVTGSGGANTTIERFFNQAAQKAEGFTPAVSGVLGRGGDPSSFTFNHPLNAEVHDLKIFNSHRTLHQIMTSSVEGPTDTSDLIFYVPPFFINENRKRNFLVTAVSSSRREYFTDTGGAKYDDESAEEPFNYPTDVFTQPYTSLPFNAGLSMTVDATDISVENFTKDIANNVYPRLVYLTSSVDSSLVTSAAATRASKGAVQDYLFWNFNTGSIRKRSLTVLPCDNGKFKPNYSLIYTGSDTDGVMLTGSEGYLYRDDLGEFDASLINLSDMFVTRPQPLTPMMGWDGLGYNRISHTLSVYTGSDHASPPEASPYSPNAKIKDGTADVHFIAYQASLDQSSNEIVLFNIPNLFYGNRIEPGSFKLEDENISGSNGKIKITLRDDGLGTLYRADCETAHATSNGVGNIFYDEGVVLIKSPHLAQLGKEQFKMTFNGEQNTHVLSIRVPCQPGLINSSSNPGFKVLSASLDANDIESEFVYITGINFHDDNMNVIMKANLAQPVVKRDDDDFLFRVKMDF